MKSHQFNLTSWIITNRIILENYLVVYKPEKNEIFLSCLITKQIFDSHEFIKGQNMLRKE